MRHSLRHIFSAITFLLAVFLSSYVFAESNSMTPGDFLSQVLQTIQGFGGLSWVLKVAAIITVIISSMKVSFLNQFIWAKLGGFQSWLAPFLGLVAGIMQLTPITVPGALAYVSAGAGAIILHELLDSFKTLPGIGDFWVQLINFIEQALGGPASHAPTTVQLEKKV